MIPQELRVAIGDRRGRRRHLEQARPELGLRRNPSHCGIDPARQTTFHCPNPSFVEASVRPAGRKCSRNRRSRSRRRATDSRRRRSGTRKNGQKTESANAAGKRSAGRRRRRQHDRRLLGLQRRRQRHPDGRPPGGRRLRRARTRSPNPARMSASPRSASTPPATRSRSGRGIDGADPHGPGRDQAARRGLRAARRRLSAAGGTAERPVLGVAPDGTATHRLARSPGSATASCSRRPAPPGGAFSAPVNAAPAAKTTRCSMKSRSATRATSSSSGPETTAPTRSSRAAVRRRGRRLRCPGRDLADQPRLLPPAAVDRRGRQRDGGLGARQRHPQHRPVGGLRRRPAAAARRLDPGRGDGRRHGRSSRPRRSTSGRSASPSFDFGDGGQRRRRPRSPTPTRRRAPTR